MGQNGQIICKSCDKFAEKGKEYCHYCFNYTIRDENRGCKEKHFVKPARKPTEKVWCICITCKEEFEKPKSFRLRNYCSQECKPKELTEAEKWANKVPDTRRRNNEAVAYAFFKPKYGVKNMVVRG
jgi:hypothetical protein